MPPTGQDAAAIVGARIRGLRTERLRVTQSDLEAMSGIDGASIRRYEGGKALPSLGGLVRLAFALGVDPGDLVRGLRPEDLADQPRVGRAADLVSERRRRMQL